MFSIFPIFSFYFRPHIVVPNLLLSVILISLKVWAMNFETTMHIQSNALEFYSLNKQIEQVKNPFHHFPPVSENVLEIFCSDRYIKYYLSLSIIINYSCKLYIKSKKIVTYLKA